MRKFVVSMTVCGLMLLAFSATASAASKARPLQGYMVGSVTFEMDATSPTGMWTHSSAVGDVSHLGASVMSAKHAAAVDFSGGHETLVAANGDEVYMTYFGGGSLPPNVGDWYDAWSDATIVGGSGRFAAASGHLRMTVSLQFLGFEAPVWPAVWSWHGTISY